MLRQIESAQRKMRILHLKKTGLGTPALAGLDKFHATIADGGTGVYTVSPNVAFAEEPCVQVTALDSGAVFYKVSATASGVTVTCLDSGETAVESDFYLTIAGSDAKDRT